MRLGSPRGGGAYEVDGGVDSGTVLLMLDGEAKVKVGDETIGVKRGEALFVAANSKLEVEDGTEDLRFVRAMRNLR